MRVYERALMHVCACMCVLVQGGGGYPPSSHFSLRRVLSLDL
nr:MAG TPA: hypothetical protein [Caudoviricetes sp.]